MSGTGAGGAVQDSTPTVSIDSAREPANQAAVVFGGNLLGTAMGFLANILIMRSIGPEGFGIFIVSMTVLTVLWLLTGRGVDQALVRCVSQRKSKDIADTEASRATVHRIKLTFGLAIAILGAAISKPLTHFLFGPEVSSAPLFTASFSSLAASLWGYTGASLQAAGSFNRFALVQVANSGVRLALVGALAIGGLLTPTLAITTTGAAYAVAAILGYALAVPQTREWSGQRELRPVIFHYSKWLVVSSLIHILYTRLDQLMLSRIAGPGSAGVFGAAANFIQIVDLLTFSLLTVWLPRFCAAPETPALRQNVKRSIGTSLILAFLIAPAYFLAEPIIGWMLGASYATSIHLFKIIFLGAIFTLVTHPLQATMHARGKTHLLTGLDVSLLCLNGVCNYWAIHWYGANGAAVVALGTRILAGVVLSAMVFLILRRDGHDQH